MSTGDARLVSALSFLSFPEKERGGRGELSCTRFLGARAGAGSCRFGCCRCGGVWGCHGECFSSYCFAAIVFSGNQLDYIDFVSGAGTFSGVLSRHEISKGRRVNQFEAGGERSKE